MHAMNIELAEQCALGKACLEEGGYMVLVICHGHSQHWLLWFLLHKSPLKLSFLP